MARGIADGSRGAPLAPPPGLRYLRSEPRRPPARLSFPDSSVRLAVKTDDLDYELPDELIAQAPLERRDGARLLVVDAAHDAPGALRDARITDLPELLPPSLIVVNDTRVMPARLFGKKPTGGAVELLLIERLSAPGDTARERWHAMGRASKGLKPGTTVTLGEAGALEAEVLAKRDDGTLEVALSAAGGSVADAIEAAGEMPLPPYIRRDAEASDRERYQTIFAREPGAVAAPTAGLHFSPTLVEAMEAAGHRFARVTLHVGPGTFRPVKHDDLDAHPMHEERYAVSEATAAAIAAARDEGRPILAVGTTVVRTLESAAIAGRRVRAGSGRTDLFIKPPYRAKVVDHVLTNFHLPRSTLLALVMALAGVETTRRAYAHAVATAYRFFSYGDAMLLRGVSEASR
ncbi:MAG: tRNA preQ1(34) S-adenosylmethionine ribosyltransferase-isomerase QueA [Sandaracinus sp.]|nr:tRNA preQ1(34) S-adenosylmethionine ribosyltransferase-isomerase QueA [Myxococcales bacterium]MAT25047.1 tRNA preQ1(34) S-adenosylmethionine ribosyltransferase-isomerase QueA [Sandaracinus sp.]MBJ74027.1 tRNA preQ1(34) S-adenosylmethionine ribosyltransferase-isomerase QueA [Sandaracinus sp.]